MVGRNTPAIKGYGKMIIRNRKTKGGGILIATKNNINLDVVATHIDEEEEQVWAKVNYHSENFILCVAYGLHESKSSEDDIDKWHYNIQKKYTDHDEEPVIIIGDMNAHVGNDEYGVPGNHAKINHNGMMWRDFIEERRMLLLNGNEKCRGKWTRTDKRSGNQSIIDLVIVNERMQSKVKQMIIDEEKDLTPARYIARNGKLEEVQSDHNCIIVELEGETRKTTNKVKRWQFQNEENLNKYRLQTEEMIAKENWLNPGNADRKYKKWFNQFKSILYECFRRVTKKSNSTTSKTTKLIQEKRDVKSKLKLLTRNSIEGYSTKLLQSELDRKTKEIADSIEEERQKRLQKRLENLLETRSEKANEIWRIRKSAFQHDEQRTAIKDANGKLMTNKDNIMKRYNEYFEELLQPRPVSSDNEKISKEIDKRFEECLMSRHYESAEINKKFTLQELEKQLKTLRNNKSPGPDEIVNELLKNAGRNLKINILNMLNWIHENEVIPSSLMELDIKALYKGKGPVTDISNYRGLFLGNTILKLLEKLISARTTPKVDKNMSETQAGGRAGRNITDHLFIIRAIIKRCKYLNKLVLIEFLDLVKAFDKMVLKNIMNDLWKCDVRGKLWRLIYIMNKQAIVSIKTSFGKTECIKIGETLKQGSVTASLLASMHTDTVNELFENQGLGTYYGNIHIGNLIFQDDMARIEENPENMNKANTLFSAFKNKNRMEFHPTKSSYIASKNIHPNITLGSTKLLQSDEYKYLGDILTPDGKPNATIKARRNKITGITAELNAILEKVKQTSALSIDAILQYHNSIILPTLLTNSETWELSGKNLQSLETIQNITLKRLMRLPPSTPTVGIRNELNILSIENQILKKRLMYLHRILNMKETNITKQILLQQKYMPGNTWLTETLTQLENLNININLEDIETKKKNAWRKMVQDAIENKEMTERENWLSNSSKCSRLERNRKTMSPYLQKLNPEEATIILKIRLKMLDLKTNFKTAHKDLSCPVCHSKEDTDTLEHLFACQKISLPENYEKIIYSNSGTDQKLAFFAKMAKAIQKLLKKRNKVLKEREEQASTTDVPSEKKNANL